MKCRRLRHSPSSVFVAILPTRAQFILSAMDCSQRIFSCWSLVPASSGSVRNPVGHISGNTHRSDSLHAKRAGPRASLLATGSAHWISVCSKLIFTLRPLSVRVSRRFLLGGSAERRLRQSVGAPCCPVCHRCSPGYSGPAGFLCWSPFLPARLRA